MANADLSRWSLGEGRRPYCNVNATPRILMLSLTRLQSISANHGPLRPDPLDGTAGPDKIGYRRRGPKSIEFRIG
jgi:hypothetical protein